MDGQTARAAGAGDPAGGGGAAAAPLRHNAAVSPAPHTLPPYGLARSVSRGAAGR